MVSLTFVIAGVFAALTLICAAALVGMRRQPALVWLMLAPSCGAVQTLVLGLADTSAADLPTATVLVPLAYLCFGQAVRIVVGERHQHWALTGAVAGLTGLSLLLLFLSVPFIWHTLPFQLACALALGESLYRLRRRTGVLDLALRLVVAAVAAIFIARIPLYFALFDGATPWPVIKAHSAEKLLLTASALLSAPAVFLLLGRIVGNVIATYRSRAERDGLTGLLNRGAFDEAAAAAGPAGGAVIFCDIDNFKHVNDHFGHQAGDAVIRAFATLIENTGHCAARIGGEEFALLLPGFDAAEAWALAEYIRARFHEAVHPGLPAGHRLSASFGVAIYGPDLAPASAFAHADTALYAAKADGRNRVVTLTPAAAPAAGTASRAA